MRNGILIISLALAVGAWAVPATAQDHGHRGDHDHEPAAHVAELQERLNLTDEQAAQIRAIITDAMERRQAILEGGRNEGSHEEIRSLHEQTHTRMAEVLTDAQRAKMKEMHEGMRHGGGDHRGDHGERHRGEI